jgi:TonB family protein
MNITIRKALAAVLLSFPPTMVLAQTTKTTYYKDKYLNKEVSAAKARYSATEINYPDSTIRETRSLADNQLLSRRVYRGEEPYGIWLADGDILDYNFDLVYREHNCTDTIPGLPASISVEDKDSLDYKAPRLAEGKTVYQFLVANIRYPERAINDGVSGTVRALFRVTEQGTIKDIAIEKSVNMLLDKEVMRLCRAFQFRSPAMRHGKAIPLCVALPVRFEIK